MGPTLSLSASITSGRFDVLKEEDISHHLLPASSGILELLELVWHSVEQAPGKGRPSPSFDLVDIKVWRGKEN